MLPQLLLKHWEPLCWVGWPGCQKGATRLGVQRYVGLCAGGNSNGFACSLLEAATSSLAPLAFKHGWELWGFAGGQVVANTFFIRLLPWLLPSPSGWERPSCWHMGLWVTAGCPLLPQHSIPAAPGALAPFSLSSFCPSEKIGGEEPSPAGSPVQAQANGQAAAGVMPT